MIWGFVIAAGIAVAAALVAAGRTDPVTPNGTERVVFLAGAVGSAFLGLVWVGFSLLLGACENGNCVPDDTVRGIVAATIVLSVLTFGFGSLLLFAAGVRYPDPAARQARKFVLAGVLCVVLWFGGVDFIAQAG